MLPLELCLKQCLSLQLEETDDADDSKDFLRITVQTPEPGDEGNTAGIDAPELALTFETTTQRKGEFVRQENPDGLPEDEAAEDGVPKKALVRRQLPTVVIQQPPSRDSQRGCVGALCSWCCSCFYGGGGGGAGGGTANVGRSVEMGQVGNSRQRAKFLNKHAREGEEQEAISLLKVENHYLQE
eukprot:SAG22_NODE_768_length_7351_cov_27.969939_4_plen_184_part_00